VTKILSLYEGLIHELVDMVKVGSVASIHLVCIDSEEQVRTLVIKDSLRIREIKEWLGEFESALNLGLRPIGMIAWTLEPETGGISPFYRIIKPYEDEEWVEDEVRQIIKEETMPASNLQLLPLALPRPEFRLFSDSEIPHKLLKINLQSRCSSN